MSRSEVLHAMSRCLSLIELDPQRLDDAPQDTPQPTSSEADLQLPTDESIELKESAHTRPRPSSTVGAAIGPRDFCAAT